MHFDEVVQQINPEIYRNFRTAIELGKWPDGRQLTVEQKEICMQAVICYENNQGVEESARVGFIDRAKVKKTPCASSSESEKLTTITVE